MPGFPVDEFKERGTDTEWDDKVFEHDGFMYFGAARNLPGIREMIDAKRKMLGGEHHDDPDGLELSQQHIDRMTAAADSFYFSGLEQDSGIGDGEGVQHSVIEEELKKAEKNLSGDLVSAWEKKHADDERYLVQYGADAPWDNSYLESVGRRIDENDADRVIQDVALERKKLDALDQFEDDNMRR